MVETATYRAPTPVAAANTRPSTPSVQIVGEEDGMPVYRLPPTHQKLSFTQKIFGQDAFIGMSAGALIATVGRFFDVGATASGIAATTGATTVASTALISAPIAFGLLGAGLLVGGLVNKMSVDKELTDGVVIKPPSRINKGTIHGAMSGVTLGAAVTLLVGALLPAGVVVAGTVQMAALAIGGTLAAYKAITGGQRQFDMEQKQYDSARHAHEIHKNGLDPARARLHQAARGFGPAVESTIGAGATVAAESAPDVATAIGEVVASVLGDEKPNHQLADNQGWHPANDAKARGYSHVAALEQRRAAAPTLSQPGFNS